MGYTLEAIIGDPGMLRPVADRWPVATVVPLDGGLSLIPMTDELFDAAGGGHPSESLGFWKLPAGLARELAARSSAGPVAYVEAEFFGGVGTQRAALWLGGRLALGPLFIDEYERSAPAGSPISQVLAGLGVGAGDHHDEFDAVGLGRHRDTEDWLS